MVRVGELRVGVGGVGVARQPAVTTRAVIKLYFILQNKPLI